MPQQHKEPCLPSLPQIYQKRCKGEMTYKAWAKDKNWLPEGKGLWMLHSIPKGTLIL